MSAISQADPVAGAILDLVSEKESDGNYEAVIGHINGMASVDLKTMTITQIYALETRLLASGMPSTAVGKYQDIKKTLQALVAKQGVDPDTTLFTDIEQDELNLLLLQMSCSFEAWRNGALTDDRLLAKMSHQWASLPDPDNGGKSHYDGDGINHAGMTLAHAYAGIAAAKALHAASQVAQPLVDDPVKMAVRAVQIALNKVASTGTPLDTDGLMDEGGSTLKAYFSYRAGHS